MAWRRQVARLGTPTWQGLQARPLAAENGFWPAPSKKPKHSAYNCKELTPANNPNQHGNGLFQSSLREALANPLMAAIGDPGKDPAKPNQAPGLQML